MKTIKSILAFSIVLVYSSSFCQNSVLQKENLPIDKKTNCYIRYLYFPNLEAYFDNLTMMYHYKVNKEWKTSSELPTNYGGYSLYNKARVTITDYDDDFPYLRLSVHKKLYPYNSKGRFTNTTASSD